MFTKKVHVFRAGDQTSAQGVQRNFSAKDLQQVVDTYDPAVHEAPLVIGHQGDSDSLPSFGWIKGFERKGDNLYAEVEFSDAARDLVKDGHYRKVSISFYSPDSQINPHKGSWSARHLALLGAAPPAVKGLEPFSFSEEEQGVFNFATALDPSQIFDEELGPTLLVEKSPLEMLREKLDEVRGDMNTAIQQMQNDAQAQAEVDTAEQSSKTASELTPASDETSPENPETQYSEMRKKAGRQGTEIAQQTAALEDNLPEDQFMEDGKISRKHAKGAHGQVMQVVENVYKELPPALKKRAQEVKEKGGFAEEDGEDVEEMDYDEVSYKTTKGGKVSFQKRGESDEEDHTGRMETARSTDNGYADRMKTGKGGADSETGRMKTPSSALQDEDRLDTPKNGTQDKDRMNTAKDGSDNATGESRWAGQDEAAERVENMDQYDVDKASYGVNSPKDASGANPAGREDADTKVPTETEESPDDTVFAVSTKNVMSDKNMRVMRQKSSDKRQATKGGSIDHAEGDKKKQLSGDFEGDVNEVVGPEGAYAEGEKKSTDKHLTPGAFDEIDEADQTVGPDGAYAEGEMDGETDIRKGKGKGGEFEGGVAETSKRSGGVFAEEHGESKNPYTKTGFGSTYDEGEDEDEEDEFSESYCGQGSMGQVKSSNPNFSMKMAEELEKLKSEHAELQKKFMEEKVKTRKAKLASFVEHLYEEGKMTDGIMPQNELIHYCEGLEFGTLEFAEGETAATKLLGLLNKLPNLVYFGEVVQGGKYEFSEQDLDPHTKAMKLVESGDASDYVEALKMALYS